MWIRQGFIEPPLDKTQFIKYASEKFIFLIVLYIDMSRLL